MGKLRQQKRKRVEAPPAIVTPPSTSNDDAPQSIEELISDEDLQTTIETLQALSEHPALVKQKRLRDLRGVVYDFQAAANSTTAVATKATTSSLTARISEALSNARYEDARVLLAEMRIRRKPPKLGALQRWVRDCDAISGVYVPPSKQDAHDTSGQDLGIRRELMLVLDAILRVAALDKKVPQQEETSSVIVDDAQDPCVLRKPTWDARPEDRPRQTIYRDVLAGTISTEPEAVTVREKFRIIDETPGPLRKPPNAHPALLYLSDDNVINLSPEHTSGPVLEHPKISAMHMLSDILSADECRRIVGACEAVGFSPDAPLGTIGTTSSVLAHNVYWLADEGFMSKLHARILPQLATLTPPGTASKPLGLNRRFRVYRYVPGALYRPHIDGAWPPSGTSLDITKSPTNLNDATAVTASGTDKLSYVYDTSNGKQMSRLTFLIYLNDEFEGGETTFFQPAPQEGYLEAYGVKPRAGSALVFPHGDVEGALLHEGSGVTRSESGSAKYIIRTDVLYEK